VFFVGVDRAMNRKGMTTAVALALVAALGCSRAAQGPMLAGGREVKSWLADLHDGQPECGAGRCSSWVMSAMPIPLRRRA